MRKVLLYLGMGSCVSAGDEIRSDGLKSTIKGIKVSPASTKSNTESPRSVMGKTPINFHTPAAHQAKGLTIITKASSDRSKIFGHDVTDSKEETFFDSKAWLDSEDEDDFVSVYGETSPAKQYGDHQARKLKELFLESSFGRDSQTSFKANEEAINKDKKSMTPKLERKKSDRSAHRCLPSLVRSVSCGDRKKRLRTSHIEVVG